MKMTFQAKNIQKMLGIARQRYEYLATKIGISPEVEEVTGRGRAHLYSFKNALQFAIAHSTSSMGLPPREIRWILDALDHLSQFDRFPIYEPEKDIQDHLFLTRYGGDRIMAIGTRIDDLTWIDEAIMEKEGEIIKSELVAQRFLPSRDLSTVESYVSFNLGLIKRKVREYANG